MASWFGFTGKRPERKKVPKMPSSSIIRNAPYTARKMVKEYLLYIDGQNKKKLK